MKLKSLTLYLICLSLLAPQIVNAGLFGKSPTQRTISDSNVVGSTQKAPLWGKIGDMLWKRKSPGVTPPGAYGSDSDIDGAMYDPQKGLNPNSLAVESEDRIVKIVNGRMNITSGRIKKDVTVTVDQFFPRYAYDFRLKFDHPDVMRKGKSISTSDGVTHQSFSQLFRSAAGDLFYVQGSGATLDEAGGKVVRFTQNLVSGLDPNMDVTPKISQAVAHKIAEKNLGLLQTMTAPLLSLLPMNVSSESWTVASLTDNSAASTSIPAGQNPLTGGPNSMAALPPDDSLIIAFDGPRKPQNARLAWVFTFDLGDNGYFKVLINAMEGVDKGKVIGKDDQSDYDDGSAELNGDNVVSHGVAIPFEGIYDDPKSNLIEFTANYAKDSELPYHLICKKSPNATPAKGSCPANIVMLDNKHETIAAKNNVFDKDEDKAPDTVFKYLQQAGWYFLVNYQWTGFTDQDDVIHATVKKLINPLTKMPSARFQNGQLFFDGYGSDKMYPQASGDLVAHEYFHGIFRSVSWASENDEIKERNYELWSIDEGLADFFGEVAGAYSNNPNPWKFGAQIFSKNDGNGFYRDLKNPKNPGIDGPLPDTYRGYYYSTDKGCPPNVGYCYVMPSGCTDGADCFNKPDPTTVYSCKPDTDCDQTHRNSTVISHMLQLLADGTKGVEITNDLNRKVAIEGIGIPNAAKIAWGTFMRLGLDDEMQDFCTKAISVAKALGISVKSVQDACFAVNLSSRYEDRSYWPSEEGKDNLEFNAWPATLTWQAFPDKGESSFLVQIASFNPDLDFITEAADAEDVQSQVKTLEPGTNKVHADFVLKPDTVYAWHICPLDKDANASEVDAKAKTVTAGNSLETKAICEWRKMQFLRTGKKITELTSPGKYVVYTEKAVPFQWTKVDGAKDYIFNTYKRNPDGTAGDPSLSAPISTNDDNPSLLVEEAGQILEGLCWSITPRGKNDSLGDESDKDCYQIQPAKVEIVSPKDKDEIPYSKADLTFTWKKAGAADSYQFTFCDRDPNTTLEICGDNELNTDTTELSHSLAGAATNTNGGCWQVAGKKDGIEGEPSDFACYSIKPPAVTTVTLMNPLDGATDVNNTTTSFSFKYSAPYSPSEETKGSNAILVSHKGGAIIRELPDGESPPSWDQYPPGSPKPTDSIKGNIGTDFPDLDHEGNYIFGGGLVGPLNLKPSTTYYWQAYQLDKDEQTILASSNIWTFKTKKLALCGDGVPDAPEEQCDLGSENGKPGQPGGDCDKNCTLPGCGNNITDPGEQCDGPDLAGATCQSQGFDTGALSCTNCAFNTSNCEKCGNSKVEPGETCEPPNTPTCDATCHIKCGNAVIDAGEECDDGNKSDNDACKNNCKKNICGDGVSGGPGEECDDGNVQGGDGCSATCKKDCNPLDLHKPTWNPDNQAYFESNPNYNYTDPSTGLIYPILGPVSNNMTLHYDCGKGAAFYSVALDILDLDNPASTWVNNIVVSPPIAHDAAYDLKYTYNGSESSVAYKVAYDANGNPYQQPYLKYLYNFRARCEDKCGTWTDWGPFDKGAPGIMHFYSPLTVGNMPVLKKKPLQSITPPAVK